MRLAILIFYLLVLIANSFTQDVSTDTAKYRIEELYRLSLDELLTLKTSSATKFEEQVKDIPHSVYILTDLDIEAFGYRTLAEILQHVPGFYVIDDNTLYKENFGVRGFYRDEWNQNIIFLVNGIRQRSGYDFNNKLTYINVPVESIKRIEIIKGPAAVSYGSGAFFGVVNIITYSNSTKNEVLISGGTQNTINTTVNIHKKIKQDLLAINVGLGKTGGIEQNYRDMSGDTSLSTQGFMDEKYAFVSMSYQNKHLLSAISLDRNYNTRPAIAPPYASKVYEPFAYSTAMRCLQKYKTSLKNKFQFNASWQFQYQHENVQFDLAGLDNDQELQISSFLSHELDLNVRYSPMEALNISVGTNAYIVPYCTDIVDVPVGGLHNIKLALDDEMYLLGAYTRFSVNILSSLKLNAGLRFDKQLPYTYVRNNNQGNIYIDPDTLLLQQYNSLEFKYPHEKIALLPEVSLNYALSPNSHLKLHYGTAINRLPIFRVHYAQAGIKPEYIKSIELNYTGTFNNTIKICSGLFYNYYYDLIAIEFQLEGNITSNTGIISTSGFEAEIEYRPMTNLRFNLSTNYYFTENITDKDIRPAFSPKFLGYFSTAYQYNRFSVAITSHFISQTEPKYTISFPEDDKTKPRDIIRKGDNSPGYLNLGTNFIWKFKRPKGLSVHFRISNILDQKMYYPVNDFNPWATKGTLGISRTLLLKLGYKF